MKDLGHIQLSEDQRAVFLAAARVLLPPELHQHLSDSNAVPESLLTAIQALWLRAGQAPAASAPMPQQPLAPGLVGIFWRRVRAALALAPRDF